MIPRKITSNKVVEMPDALSRHNNSQPSISMDASQATPPSNSSRAMMKVSQTATSSRISLNTAIRKSG